MPNMSTFSIGRAEDNDMVLNHPSVSGHHARLVKTPSGLVIEDLASTNHTYVNGVQVRRAGVRHGDSIMFSAHCALSWSNPLLLNWLRQPLLQSSASPPLPDYSVAQGKNLGMPLGSAFQPRNAQPASLDRRFDPTPQERRDLVQHPEVIVPCKDSVSSGSSIPDKCPNCGSSNIRKLSLHKEKKKGGGGCNSCLLLIIIGLFAPGLIIALGLGAALGLAGLTYFVVENKELFIAGGAAILIIGIMVSIIKSRTYICEKCGSKFR